jgi:hypothetical protein
LAVFPQKSCSAVECKDLEEGDFPLSGPAGGGDSLTRRPRPRLKRPAGSGRQPGRIPGARGEIQPRCSGLKNPGASGPTPKYRLVLYRHPYWGPDFRVQGTLAGFRGHGAPGKITRLRGACSGTGWQARGAGHGASPWPISPKALCAEGSGVLAQLRGSSDLIQLFLKNREVIKGPAAIQVL